jgi:hypothetical protein
MTIRPSIAITVIGGVLLYSGTSVCLSAYWRAQAVIYQKNQERDGDVRGKQLEQEGRNIVAERERQATTEEARIINAARVKAAEILAAANKEGAEIRAKGPATVATTFLLPYLWPSKLATKLGTH